MSKTIGLLKKLLVLAIGLPLFALGIILIPLPGPGLLVCCAALFILSLEFAWADRYFQQLKGKLRAIFDKSKAEYNKRKDGPRP